MDFSGYLQGYLKSGSVNGPLLGEALRTLLQAMSPFAPHLSEELWEAVGMKGFVSASKWPEKRKADRKAMEIEEIASRLQEDIGNVIKLTGITPKGIRIIVSHEWKYALLKKLAAETKKTRNPGEAMKALMSDSALRQHGKEISKLVPTLIKNPERIRAPSLTAKEELSVIEELAPPIGEELSCRVSVELAEKSDSQKARQSMPGKPGIEVS